MPTSIEQGVPAFQAVGWNMLFAPKGTPPEILETLAAVQDALKDPVFQKRLVDLGAVVPKPNEADPASSRELVRTEIDKWVPVLTSAGIRETDSALRRRYGAARGLPATSGVPSLVEAGIPRHP